MLLKFLWMTRTCLSYIVNTKTAADLSDLTMKKLGGRLNIKMLSYQYRDPHVKDKTVSPPSYLQHRNQPTWERQSLYWDGAQNLPVNIIPTDDLVSLLSNRISLVHGLRIKWRSGSLVYNLCHAEKACPSHVLRGGWGCEVSCGGHHRPKGKTTTGSALDGAVFGIAQILAYLVHNMSRSQLYLGFGHFGWLPSFFGQ